MSKFFEPLENRQLLSLVIDVRVAGGGKTATVNAVGDVVNLEVWALVSGSNGITTDEGLQIADGSYLSTNVGGGAANGTLQSSLVSPFNASGSTFGAQVDLDGDSDLDVGSNDETSATGFFFARSSILQMGTQFKIGTVKFTVTSLKSTTGSTNLNYRIRNWVSGALWKEDGNNILKNGVSGGYSAGTPVVVKTTTGGTPDSGVISGKVWNDSDGDGILDTGETGKSGVQVFLDADQDGSYDAGENTKTSDSSGNYTFADLAVGTHRVRIVTPGGFAITAPAAGYFDVTLNNTTASGKNFGLKTITTGGGSISGRIFNDGDKDGVYDSGESLLANRKIYIDANSNGHFDTGEKSALSNASGVYAFTGLAAGNYRLGRADLPTGYYLSVPVGGFHIIDLAAGQVLTGKDFGAVQGTPPGTSGSISGTVFSDSNKNGILDAGEPILASRRIYIDADSDGTLDSGEISVLSNSSGVYKFTNLAAGSYRLGRADLPSGYYLTTPAGGFHVISLASAEVVTGKNFGAATGTVSGLGSISGRVFNDGDKDGAYDSGESLLARKVYIDTNNNGKLDTGEKSLYSNSAGVYTFSGLAAGSYIIRRADLPAGYYITTPLVNVTLSSGQNVTGKDIGAALV